MDNSLFVYIITTSVYGTCVNKFLYFIFCIYFVWIVPAYYFTNAMVKWTHLNITKRSVFCCYL